jgi:hypothetical protein
MNSVWRFRPVTTDGTRLEIRQFPPACSTADHRWARRALALFATAGAITALPLALPRSADHLLRGPLFVAEVLIGIATLMYNRNVLIARYLPRDPRQSTYGLSFAFLILTAGATTGAWTRPWCLARARCAPSSRTPAIWPACSAPWRCLGVFEVSFYNLGAVPTLPTVAWARCAMASSPAALATLVNLRSSFSTCCCAASCALACRVAPPLGCLPRRLNRPDGVIEAS